MMRAKERGVSRDGFNRLFGGLTIEAFQSLIQVLDHGIADVAYVRHQVCHLSQSYQHFQSVSPGMIGSTNVAPAVRHLFIDVVIA